MWSRTFRSAGSRAAPAAFFAAARAALPDAVWADALSGSSPTAASASVKTKTSLNAVRMDSFPVTLGTANIGPVRGAMPTPEPLDHLGV